jgi:excisionase family DNA binding protein
MFVVTKVNVMATKQLITTVEASKRLKLSLTHVYYLIRTGELKPVKVQRSYYFQEEDLESFIHERELRKSNKVQPAILN